MSKHIQQSVVFGLCMVAAVSYAQEPSKTDSKSSADYKDIENMERLEADAFRPVVVSANSIELDLIAPQAGFIASARQETGQPAGAKLPTGSEMLRVPEIRAKLQGTKVLGLQKVDEPSVRAYLDFFDGRGKPILSRWISRMGRYRPLIEKKLKAAGLPTDLIYVAMIESGFSPWARSPAAAVGVWQFIPSTGRMMGLRIDGWIDERRDPEKATDAAIGYLTSLKDKFGSWELALASYNGGPGLVSKTISRLNTNNYWLIQRRDGLYDETRRYVPKIIAAGLVTKNAHIFGLDTVHTEPAMEFDVVSIPKNTRLSLVAEGAGVSLKTIEDLNPKFLNGQTPPNDGPYHVRIPKGTESKFVQRFDQFRRGKNDEHVRHTVKFGETVGDIATIYGVPERVIRFANGVKNRQRIPYGSSIIIPAPKRTKAPTTNGKRLAIVPTKGFSTTGKTRHFYRVNDGDTLDLIAMGLAVKSSDIVLWNQVDPNAKLKKGMLLQVYLPTDADLTAVSLIPDSRVQAVAKGSMDEKRALAKKRSRGGSGKRRYHKVRNGESLWIIARRYKGVTVMDLRRWNPRLRRSNMLQPGDMLVIYPKKK